MSSPRTLKSASRFQCALILVLVLALGLSWIEPIYPRQQVLQHAPMPLVFALLCWAACRGWFSQLAFACLIAFLGLHILGARYIYSFVPGGEALTWLELGGENSGRNQYDRLVHLAFGALMMPALVEGLRRHLPLLAATSVAVLVLFACGAAYEIFEWLLTVVADPVNAARYNGQQGDLWDPQKDMVLALLGSLVVAPFAHLASSEQNS